MPTVTKLNRGQSMQELAHEVVAQLESGGVVAVPTEWSYALFASAIDPLAVQKMMDFEALCASGAVDEDWHTSSLCLVEGGQVQDYASTMTPFMQRFLERCWPGPIDVFVPANESENGNLLSVLPEITREFISAPGGRIHCSCPSHPFVREIVTQAEFPLIQLAPGICSTGRTASEIIDINHGVLEQTSMIVDDGPTRYHQPATHVTLDGDSWGMLSSGLVHETTIKRMLNQMILFVCTGNTCRSPMAEGVCRSLLARRLKCSTDELIDRGFNVLSAGISAVEGQTATAHAVELLLSRGIDLTTHFSRQISHEMLAQPDFIFTMTQGHRQALLSVVPELAGRVDLLSPDHEDIIDPYGGSQADYQQCLQLIESALQRRIDQFLLQAT
ncbi:arsenate reductase/protein-tyrosine-phosphatase family protein [Lacunimicrobium album]